MGKKRKTSPAPWSQLSDESRYFGKMTLCLRAYGHEITRVSHWKNFPCLLFSFSEQSLRIPALVGMPCMRYLHCQISQQGVSLQLQLLCLGNICTALMAPHCHVGMQDGAANHQQSWWWHCLHEGKYAHLSEGQCPGCQIRSPQWSLRETLRYSAQLLPQGYS